MSLGLGSGFRSLQSQGLRAVVLGAFRFLGCWAPRVVRLWGQGVGNLRELEPRQGEPRLPNEDY